MPDRKTSRTRTAPGPAPQKAPTEFGAWLLGELKRREWLQGDLAHATQTERTVVSRWIYKTTPTPRSCEKIAAAFGIPVSDVLRRAGHPIDEYQPVGDLQQRIALQLRNIPDVLLAPLVPMIEALARPPQQEAAIAEVRRRLAALDEDAET